MAALEPATTYQHYGFSYISEFLQPFTHMHRHDEVELGLPSGGGITALFGAKRCRVENGQFGVFWANQPHGPLQVDPHTRAEVILVPLPWVLGWNLPAPFVHRLLHGELFLEQHSDQAVFDTARLRHWVRLMRLGTPDAKRLVLLEIEARLLWLAMQLRSSEGELAVSKEIPHRPAQASHFEQMIQYIAEHFLETLSVPQIAEAVSLHPNYAMRLFRETAGVTLLEYVVQHRISLAQRLLATTDMKILDLVEECGFRSPARFYAMFSRLCGQTPAAFRRSLRQNKDPIDLQTKP
jgi:AraC family transcriptional regulator, melibiose operon regulatory protein